MQITHMQNHLGEYHDFYVQNDTLLSADAFENNRNMSENIRTWSCKFLFSSWISMASSFKKKIDQN